MCDICPFSLRGRQLIGDMASLTWQTRLQRPGRVGREHIRARRAIGGRARYRPRDRNRARLEAARRGRGGAGLRTLALSGLLGGIWGALALNAGQAGLIALALAFTSFTAAIAVFRYHEMVHEKTFGATTVVAAMLAFALGALAVLGDKTAAAAAGVAAALLLALKAVLHEWVKRLTWEELRAGLILAAMTVILLPLLPDRELSPASPSRCRIRSSCASCSSSARSSPSSWRQRSCSLPGRDRRGRSRLPRSRASSTSTPSPFARPARASGARTHDHPEHKK
jgi:hypothetical protein